MQISFTGSNVTYSRFNEGRAFPDSSATIGFQFSNEGKADLDRLNQILENKPQYKDGDLAVFNVLTKNEGENGITKKFLLNWKELPATKENENIFSFFAKKMKELKRTPLSGETETAVHHIHAEISIVEKTISPPSTEELLKRIENRLKGTKLHGKL